MQREYQTETANISPIRAETFGARLRRLRIERKISQVRFARLVGVSKPTVWKWERDEVRPRPKSLEAAALILCVSERALLFGGGEARRPEPEKARPSSPQLREIVNACKQQIARAAGTGTEKVLITIHV